ncbi:MAG: DUF1573 domain-containing protein, partial [Flavobacteriales bacterium]|nr:DUF1573 domain-containing protein [Flavobacteriales bacterium]
MRIWLVILFIGIHFIAVAQTQKQWFELGEEAMLEMNYEAAAHYFKEAYVIDSTDFDVTIQLAESKRLAREYKDALYYYEKAFKKDRGRLFKPGQYYVGLMQKQLGDYQNALKNFKKFYSKTKRKPLSETPLAELEIESCVWALKTRKIEGKAKVERLEGDVNTGNSEFAPFWLDSMLYYTSTNGEDYVNTFSSIFLANQTDSVYWKDRTFESNANVNQKDCGNLVFNADKSRAYFSICEDVCRIYEGEVVDGQITSANPISALNHDGCTATQPFIGYYKGKEYLFYASNRSGTRGGMDIWWCEKRADGSWSAPVNAGDNENTIGDQLTPSFINKQLYYSSNSHVGYGGFDIMLSKGYPRSFDVAENIGYPVNTSYNEFYYNYSLEAGKAFFASNRPENDEDVFCCNDIFSVEFRDSIQVEEELPYPNLQVLNDYLPVTLYFHNDEPNPNTRDTTTNLTYIQSYDSYTDLLPKYIRENEKGKNGDEKLNAKLQIESFFELTVDKGVDDLGIFEQLLFKELELGNSVELVIKGFASPRAQSDYNVNLTKRRISSLINYLESMDDGKFIPYINQTSSNGAVLKFREVPFGEYQSKEGVSDLLEDEQNSIYSIPASLERKIEIQSVENVINEEAEFKAETTDWQFNNISSSQIQEVSFEFLNIGLDSLQIDSIVTSCGCTS